MRNSYPLQFPIGVARTQDPQHARFETGLSRASENVVKQLERMGATDIVITSNMQYKSNGLPYARQSYIEDTGVAVYFRLEGEEKCIAVDKWIRVADNMQAIAKIIEALRGLDRWGSKDLINAAFRGFTALPAQASASTRRSCWEILGLAEPDHLGYSEQTIRSMYRAKARRAHPDAGGSDAEFAELEQALRDALVSQGYSSR